MSVRTIENITKSFVINEPNVGSRVMSFGEFDNIYQTRKLVGYEFFQKAVQRFLNFNPRCKPVLWRILLAQAHLYQGLLNSNKARYSQYFERLDSDVEKHLTPDMFMIMSSIPASDLNWHREDVNYFEIDVDPIKAVNSYLGDKLLEF